MEGNRYGLQLKDGSMIWVNEEQYRKIENGEIDPNRPLTPEEEKWLDEMNAEESIRLEKMAKELLSKK